MLGDMKMSCKVRKLQNMFEKAQMQILNKHLKRRWEIRRGKNWNDWKPNEKLRDFATSFKGCGLWERSLQRYLYAN